MAFFLLTFARRDPTIFYSLPRTSKMLGAVYQQISLTSYLLLLLAAQQTIDSCKGDIVWFCAFEIDGMILTTLYESGAREAEATCMDCEAIQRKGLDYRQWSGNGIEMCNG
jgi:hypothetical protein